VVPLRFGQQVRRGVALDDGRLPPLGLDRSLGAVKLLRHLRLRQVHGLAQQDATELLLCQVEGFILGV
jgi:hypothetical protein